MQDYRVDERERQRACRQRRRETDSAEAESVACHAPPSAGKPANLMAKLLESWDRAAAVSRATLVRSLPVVLQGLVPGAETGKANAGARSRAGLER